MRFRATLQLHGKSATGIEVPPEIVTALADGKRPKVRATINGHTYPTSVGSMGGRFLLPVSADVRAAAGIAAGDEIDVDIVGDTEPRTVTVPDDLAAALDDADVRSIFDGLSYSNQRRHVLAVTAAKTTATRERRIARTVDDLREAAAGRGRPR
jgi:hypothetical protein